MGKRENYLLYEHQASVLRERILNGNYVVGERLPSEGQLAVEFNVSRPTIKQALRLLETENLIECRSSIGSFVLRKPSGLKMIGYIAPDLSDPFHGDLMSRLQQKLRESNCQLIISDGGLTQQSYQDAAKHLVKGGAQGLIVCLNSEVHELSNVHVPIVYCGATPDVDDFDKVNIDNEKGIIDLMKHLKSLGCQKFGFMYCGNFADKKRIRQITFNEFIVKNQLITKPNLQKGVNLSGLEGGAVLFHEFMREKELPDAIVCHNDWAAIGFMNEARKMNIAIPEKLKITGFDNLLINKFLPTTLTTIDYNLSEIIEQTVALLQRRIDDPFIKPLSIKVRGQLVIGESTVLSEGSKAKKI